MPIVCDPNSAFFGFMGIAAASVFCNMGCAYGTAKSGVGICSAGVMSPHLIIKSVLPVILAGVLGVYGFIVAILISQNMGPDGAPTYSAYAGYAHLTSGLTCGLSSLAAGMVIGIVGDAGVRANAQQPRLYVGMLLILIFAEALALYGWIISLIVALLPGGNLCTSFTN
eukprot:GHVP01054066.1.p2 GENE.GHVP01054066.1~~GHVP01054066.1.p2  ORF type:complete len:169 (-),score=21.99 GHVP01054066.1:553-1059(-)